MDMKAAVSERLHVLRAFDLPLWCQYMGVPLPKDGHEARALWRALHKVRSSCPDLSPEERSYSLMALRWRFPLDPKGTAYAGIITSAGSYKLPQGSTDW